MIYLNEEQKKLENLYSKLQNLKEGKKLIERAMHYNYYNREMYSSLFIKLNKVTTQIAQIKKEINEEKKKYEKSGKNI